MHQRLKDTNALLISYVSLRLGLGVLVMLLPPVLPVGGLIIKESRIESSVSAYYHTPMGDVFVGTLCAIGVFLIAYKGYGRIDNWLGTFAGAFVIGVALFPTDHTGASHIAENVGRIHISFAILFFAATAIFCIFLFTNSDKPRGQISARKAR